MTGKKNAVLRLTQGAFAMAMCFGLQAPAQAYDQLYVFGDSLSDTGNIGRWTFDSSSHQLYDEILAQNIGTPLTPSSKGGRTMPKAAAWPCRGWIRDYTTQDQVKLSGRYRWQSRSERAVYSLDWRQRFSGSGTRA